MKTIKIIDLLNMIANKEYDKLPKKIEYNYRDYELYTDAVPFYFFTRGHVSALLLEELHSTRDLLKEVEIIEDAEEEEEDTPSKIEKIPLHIGAVYRNEDIINKINEIIDYIDKGDKKWI